MTLKKNVFFSKIPLKNIPHLGRISLITLKPSFLNMQNVQIRSHLNVPSFFYRLKTYRLLVSYFYKITNKVISRYVCELACYNLCLFYLLSFVLKLLIKPGAKYVNIASLGMIITGFEDLLTSCGYHSP